MTASNELIYGLHAVEALLVHQPHLALVVYISQRRDPRLRFLVEKARALNLTVEASCVADLEKKLPAGSVHQGVAALVRCKVWSEQELPGLLERASLPTILVLDQVTDPHNLGACMRSANGFGVTAVIAPQDGAAKLTPVARKVACGAAAVTPFIRVKNLARTLRALKEAGLWIVGTAGEESAYIQSLDLTGPLALVMGAEGRGMRQLTRRHCDYLAQIPLSGSVSSLNVSVATGISLYEMQRQRFQVQA